MIKSTASLHNHTMVEASQEVAAGSGEILPSDRAPASMPPAHEPPKIEGVARAPRLERLVADHIDALHRYVRRLGVYAQDVDDVLHEVVVRLSTRLDRIEPGSERAYAFGAAYRVVCEWRRRPARRELSTADAVDDLAAGTPSPEALSDEARAREVLDRILREMPIELSAVFVLYEIEEHTMAEIAIELQIPAGTVASRLRRARALFESAVLAFESSHGRTP